MKINQVIFSPTHTGRTVAEAVAVGFASEISEISEATEATEATEGLEVTIRTVDLTLPSEANAGDILVDGVAVFAVPVYGGRVAEMAAERLQRVKASEPGKTPAILIVVYGNRDYEDALLELRDLVVRQGFVPLAAGAFVGEHSYSRPEKGMPIAQGRPDALDCENAKRFGAEARAKYDNGRRWPELTVKGNVPYKEKGPSTPATPMTDPAVCTGCGICVEVCPTDVVSFSANGIAVSDTAGCIKCCACVKFCPAGARRFDTPYTEMLFRHFSVRREPELFLV